MQNPKTEIRLPLVEILNPVDERVEAVLKRAGCTLGQETAFGEVIGVSARQRLVLRDETDCYVEMEV